MKPLRVAVDVSIQETSTITGVERVQRSLLRALAELAPDYGGRGPHEFLLIGQRRVPELGFEPPPEWKRQAAVADGSPYLWRERFVPALLDRNAVDVFHSGVSATPVLGRAKKIATLHELPWVERGFEPSQMEVGKRGHRVWLFLNVRYASRLVAVSNRTRENILGLYPDAEDRVVVIPHGVDACFTPLPRAERESAASHRRELLARFGAPDRPYLLFVGTLRRKKNLRALLRVFANLPAPERRTHQLVLAGVRHPGWTEFEELLRLPALKGRVLLTGYVSDADLVELYRHAAATIYPSLFEGFGLPPLEAMACGSPVLASTGGAIPEVVGDAALSFPPDDPRRMQEAILRVLREPELASDLRERGARRARRFTWRAAAERYLDLYRDVVPSCA